jgi:hypothetical protein
MKAAAVLAIGLVLAVAAVACSGDDSEAERLTLDQRALTEEDAPDSEPDPVETRLTAESLDEFKELEDANVIAAGVDRAELEEAGLVSAIHDTRFFPEAPGDPHTRDAPHVRMLVVEFDSEEGAAAGAELLHQQTLKPCPGDCSARFEEFDVSGVPDASGTSRVVTQERLDQLNEDGEPSDSYTITFADGQFVYAVEGFGPPGAVTEEDVEEIAQRVHHRVAGAPPA